MHYLNHTCELLTGGHYTGNRTWSKPQTDIDKCFKIYQMEKGSATIESDCGTYVLREGGTYLINGFRICRQSCEETFSTRWLHFLPNDLLLFRSLQALPCVVPLPAGTYSLAEPWPIEELQGDCLPHLPYPLVALHYQNLLGSIIVDVLSRQEYGLATPNPDMERIAPALQHITGHYRENIYTDELARLCCLSQQHFHRVFKQCMKITPANYQLLLRMNASLQLLGAGKLSVKEIADELGFTDTAHFCNSFKQHYGLTPLNYRKQTKENIF